MDGEDRKDKGRCEVGTKPPSGGGPQQEADPEVRQEHGEVEPERVRPVDVVDRPQRDEEDRAIGVDPLTTAAFGAPALDDVEREVASGRLGVGDGR